MNKIKSNFEGQTIFVGMDIHKSSWNLGIHLNDMFVKNVHQKPKPHIMASYLNQHYPGAHYKAVYEAGKFGFWIQRQLTQLGIECLAVNPADIPKSQKDTLQKTDPRDARNLSMRHIPDEQQEADLAFFRHRKKIWKDLTRCKNRIKGMLAFSGIDIPDQFDNASWSHNFIKWLKEVDCKQQSRKSALNYMIAQMEFLRKELLCDVVRSCCFVYLAKLFYSFIVIPKVFLTTLQKSSF